MKHRSVLLAAAAFFAACSGSRQSSPGPTSTPEPVSASEVAARNPTVAVTKATTATPPARPVPTAIEAYNGPFASPTSCPLSQEVCSFAGVLDNSIRDGDTSCLSRSSD